MTKILYIEDNEDNIFMLQTRLERKGFEMLIATDGLKGYEMAVHTMPDLILLDVGLPGMDGYDTAKTIKADTTTANIPIIMLTAHAMSADRDKALQSGAEDYESKPVNLNALIEKINYWTQEK